MRAALNRASSWPYCATRAAVRVENVSEGPAGPGPRGMNLGELKRAPPRTAVSSASNANAEIPPVIPRTGRFVDQDDRVLRLGDEADPASVACAVVEGRFLSMRGRGAALGVDAAAAASGSRRRRESPEIVQVAADVRARRSTPRTCPTRTRSGRRSARPTARGRGRVVRRVPGVTAPARRRSTSSRGRATGSPPTWRRGI